MKSIEKSKVVGFDSRIHSDGSRLCVSFLSWRIACIPKSLCVLPIFGDTISDMLSASNPIA